MWLRKFVKNGPVSKAVLYDVDRQNKIFTFKAKLKQIEYDYSDFKSKYFKNYREPMVSFCLTPFTIKQYGLIIIH